MCEQRRIRPKGDIDIRVMLSISLSQEARVIIAEEAAIGEVDGGIAHGGAEVIGDQQIETAVCQWSAGR